MQRNVGDSLICRYMQGNSQNVIYPITRGGTLWKEGLLSASAGESLVSKLYCMVLMLDVLQTCWIWEDCPNTGIVQAPSEGI